MACTPQPPPPVVYAEAPTAPPSSVAEISLAPPGLTSANEVISAPSLPATIEPGELTSVPIPGYRPATVVHGGAQTSIAMVYLHGVCGQVSRIRDWSKAASDFVTTIAPLGNKACPDSKSRFSWNQDIELIDDYIGRALDAVATTRNGLLDTSAVVVFGYSQGASRAERLAERFPERYRWVILGGPPRPPVFERFEKVAGLALLVGTEEHQESLAELARDFTQQGVRTHFDQFAGVGHGFFGESSPEVMRRTLTWLRIPLPR